MSCWHSHVRVVRGDHRTRDRAHFYMSRALKSKLIIVAALCMALAGCGIRGSLEAPPEAKATGTAVSPEAHDAGKDSAAKKKQHRPFVLDGLLR